MDANITFCAFEKCPNEDCMRFFTKAPDKQSSWFAVRPRENRSCDYYLGNKKNKEDL